MLPTQDNFLDQVLFYLIMFWNIASFCSLNSYFHKPWTWGLNPFHVCLYSYLSSFHSNLILIICFILTKYSGFYERWGLTKHCHWTNRLGISQFAWKQSRVIFGKVSFRDNVFWRQWQQCWNPLLSSISHFFQFKCKFKIWQVIRCTMYLATELLNW